MTEREPPGADEIADRTLVAIYDYWNRERAGRWMPARADIDPTEIGPLLPNVFMVDVSHDPLRFRYRLIGTAIVNFVGRDFTGRAIDEATYGESAAFLQQILKLTVETREPVGLKGNVFYIAGREWVGVEGILLPLASDGRTVDIVMAGYVAVDRTAAEPPPPPGAARRGFRILPRPVIRRPGDRSRGGGAPA